MQDSTEFSLFDEPAQTTQTTEFVCPVRREINAAYEGGLWEDTDALYYSVAEDGAVVETGALQSDLQFWIMNMGIELARMELNERAAKDPEQMFTIANKPNKKYIVGRTRQEIFDQLLILIFRQQLLALLAGMRQYMSNTALVRAMMKIQDGSKSAIVINKIDVYDNSIYGLLDTLYNLVAFIADTEDIKIEDVEFPNFDLKDKTVLIAKNHKLSERELYFESGKIMLSFVDHLRPVQDAMTKIMSTFSNIIYKIYNK